MGKLVVDVGGQKVDAEAVEFSPLAEPWSQYQLADGTVVKIKLVVSEILQLGIKDPVTGQPQYLIKSSNVASVEPSRPKVGIN